MAEQCFALLSQKIPKLCLIVPCLCLILFMLQHPDWAGFSSLTCSCHIWLAGHPKSGCSDTSWPSHRPPLRSCRCQPSFPQVHDSGRRVPRHWDPDGEWWFGRAGRRVGWGEGVRHRCDPDNTQRKTVASSNNGCSGKKGKRKMETNENEGNKTGMWNSTVVNNGSSLWLQKTKSRIDIHVLETRSTISP